MPTVPYDNEKISAWADKNLQAVKAEIDALGIQHRPKSPSPKASRNSITKKIRVRNGQIDKISYGMPRTMVFVHKGVGNGTPISKVGQTNRIAKQWFDNPTNRNFDELQQIVAENDATYVINNLSIK
ncbi:MAG: hypothetical protein WCI49_16525 [Ferruginibacter sp.]